MNKYIIAAAIGLGLTMTSCYDLDRDPEGVLSSSNPFTTTGEMSSYLDQFYQTAVRTQDLQAGGGSGIAGGDCNSDNMASPSVNQRIAGRSSVSGASSLSAYTYIRRINFFLNNLDNCDQQTTAAYQQAVGEGYYFRAWYYYSLLLNYGPVAWVETPLDPDMEQMKLPRENRTVIADHILADLDMAIQNLNERSNSSTMRVHRDVARALK
ncbi:MAG: RagB/SusD family nutrient uptake outer membrane protein, partial [Paramuribaculum sp.]|nr:RagB/SusD family nutrient uptake outer membrane protein [Paramuribaculum sp.]